MRGTEQCRDQVPDPQLCWCCTISTPSSILGITMCLAGHWAASRLLLAAPVCNVPQYVVVATRDPQSTVALWSWPFSPIPPRQIITPGIVRGSCTELAMPGLHHPGTPQCRSSSKVMAKLALRLLCTALQTLWGPGSSPERQKDKVGLILQLQ